MAKVSRVWIIRKLCQKHFKAVRPTAIQINNIIKKYNLNMYTEDGKKRSKEAMQKDIAKAYAKLK
tara:strand:+ start:445 stop:639 length:195 start_codon:yes stop_codon:yes gene_type:complete